MALANYLPTCGKNVPGNRREFYIAPTGTVTALAETSGEISTLTAAADSFKRVKADIDSVQFTSDGTFTTSGAYTQNLIARFSNPSTSLNTLLDELRDGVACGFEIIHVDGNGNVWLSGVSVSTKEGSQRPWNSVQIADDSGAVPTDENLQSATVTFSRLSAYRPVPLDATLAAAVLGGTAAYIEFPA